MTRRGRHSRRPSWASLSSSWPLLSAGEPLPRESVTVRGVPAAYFENGLRLELYTGKATVMIFGPERAQIQRAAAALRGRTRLHHQRQRSRRWRNERDTRLRRLARAAVTVVLVLPFLALGLATGRLTAAIVAPAA